MQTLKEKILEQLGSLSFWLITLAWLGAYVALIENNGFVLSELFNQLAFWLGSLATKRVINDFGKAMGGQVEVKKKEETI